MRRFFSEEEGHPTPFLKLTSTYSGLQVHLTIFYLVCAYFSFRTYGWHPLDPGDRTPPYLFYFIQYYPNFLFSLGFLVTPPLLLLSAVFPKKKSLSAVALLSYIHWAALTVTSGITDNGIRPSVWLAICLLFLPFPKSSQRHEIFRFTQWYWFSFFIFILTYVMAGLWKLLWGGFYQLFFDNFGIWNPQSMSYVIYNYLVKTGNKGMAALWIADNPWLGWPTLLIAIYIECSIFIVFFRPSLWKLYAFGILCMHIGTKLALDIGFETQFLLAGLLLFTSPFFVSKGMAYQISELPLLKCGFSLRKKRR